MGSINSGMRKRLILILTAPRKSESKSQFNETHSKLTFSCLTGTQDTLF